MIRAVSIINGIIRVETNYSNDYNNGDNNNNTFPTFLYFFHSNNITEVYV